MRFAEHDDIETPHGNTIVWRYMSLEKFLDLVTHERLFFTNASNLTDEYEISLPQNLIESKKRTLKEKGLPEDEVEHRMAKFTYHNRPMRDLTLVNCWSISRHESYALWKIYLGGTEGGVAIRTTFSRLKRSITNSHSDFPEDIYAGEVKYKDYLPEDEISRFKLITTKREFYEYENELRLFIIHFPKSEGGEKKPYDRQNGRYVNVDLDELAKELYISPFMATWFSDAIEKMIEKTSPNLVNRLKTSSIRDQ